MSSTVLARTSSAEWWRIWGVRSSWVLAGGTALAVLGVGFLLGLDLAEDPSDASPGTTAWDGGRITAMFTLFGVLALAVVTSTADHSTGGIGPTLQWTPRRGVLLTARSGVIVAATTLVGTALACACSLLVWALVPSIGLPAGDGLSTVGGLVFVFATGAALAVGLGLLTRSTAGAMVCVVALVLVLPFLLAQLGYDWSVELASVMPGAGALFLIFGEGPADDMTTTSSRLTLAVWAVGALVLGGWRLLRSDADR